MILPEYTVKIFQTFKRNFSSTGNLKTSFKIAFKNV